MRTGQTKEKKKLGGKYLSHADHVVLCGTVTATTISGGHDATQPNPPLFPLACNELAAAAAVTVSRNIAQDLDAGKYYVST